MTHDLRVAAMHRYHAGFDSAQYNAIGEHLASSLYTERDDARVADGMVALQDACLELSGHPDQVGACHRLAIYCGLNVVSFNVIDMLRDYLRRFADGDDVRIEDFDCTARAIVRAYSGMDDLKTAASCANGVHSWQGRAAYALLHAVEYLTLAAMHLLQRSDEAYVHEKLKSGLRRITGALYEGVRHSPNPAQYNFRSTHFPDERDPPKAQP